MVLDKLGQTLRDSLRKIARAGHIDKETLDATVKDIQRALLAADVQVKLVSTISENIKKRAWDEKPKSGLSQREHVVHVVYEELMKSLGGEQKTLELPAKAKVMLVGLFGSGKTTTCAKLAKHWKDQGLKVSLISTDVERPAAYEQLKQLGAEIQVPVYGEAKEKDPVKILKKHLADAEKETDVVIIDSAGRSAMDEVLKKELEKIRDYVKADYALLVMPADLGQKAAEQATGFNEITPLAGVILTKLDSSAKGGGALSACSSLDIPIMYVGTGEKTSAFESFNPTKFISKLLGMGDIESLVKKTQEIFKDVSQNQMESMVKGNFNLKDLYGQIQGMKKMGPLSKVLEMLPMGVDLPKEQVEMSQDKMKNFTTIMDSMTPEEMEKPEVLDGNRVKRVAAGSGTSVEDVRALLKQYNMTRKMMKRFGKNKRGLEKMMRGFKGKMPGM